MNTRVEELDFLISIITELKNKYKEHNSGILQNVLQQLQYQRELEEKQEINKNTNNK